MTPGSRPMSGDHPCWHSCRTAGHPPESGPGRWSPSPQTGRRRPGSGVGRGSRRRSIRRCRSSACLGGEEQREDQRARNIRAPTAQRRFGRRPPTPTVAALNQDFIACCSLSPARGTRRSWRGRPLVRSLWGRTGASSVLWCSLNVCLPQSQSPAPALALTVGWPGGLGAGLLLGGQQGPAVSRQPSLACGILAGGRGGGQQEAGGQDGHQGDAASHACRRKPHSRVLAERFWFGLGWAQPARRCRCYHRQTVAAESCLCAQFKSAHLASFVSERWRCTVARAHEEGLRPS